MKARGAAIAAPVIALVALVALLAATPACAPTKVTRPDPEPVAYVPEPEPEREAPAPPSRVRWSVALDGIGWDHIPGEPPDRAFDANTQGWRHHERGDWKASKTHFADAIDRFSEYDLARYNLACAHARLNELDAALDQLTIVLTRDFPRFKRKALEDGDLGNLRRSGLNAELEHRYEVIEEVWAQAMRAGTPVIAWREWSKSSIAQAQGGQGQLLRPGAWLHDVRRFVPAMELREGVYSGFVDVERQQAVIVTGARTADTPPQFRDARLFVAPLSPVGEAPREAGLEWEGLDTIEVHAVAEGARVRLNRHKTAWRELRAGGLVREHQDLPDRPVMLVTPDGSLLTTSMPPGWDVKNRTASWPGGTARLQSTHSIATHRSVLLNADETWAVVVGVRLKCGKKGPELRHAVDRVDLGSRRAEGLSNRDGAAAAYWGRDGALYLQVDERTIRYASPGDARFETLPESVLLAPPMAPPTCKDPQ